MKVIKASKDGGAELYVEWISEDDITQNRIGIRRARIKRNSLSQALKAMLERIDIGDDFDIDYDEFDTVPTEEIIESILYAYTDASTLDRIIFLKDEKANRTIIDDYFEEEQI